MTGLNDKRSFIRRREQTPQTTNRKTRTASTAYSPSQALLHLVTQGQAPAWLPPFRQCCQGHDQSSVARHGEMPAPALLTVRSICSDADPLLGLVILVDHDGFAIREITSGTPCQKRNADDILEEASEEWTTQPSMDSSSNGSVRATPELKAKIRMRLASLMRAMIRTEVSRTTVKRRRLNY
jgi:hypothetical protein